MIDMLKSILLNKIAVEIKLYESSKSRLYEVNMEVSKINEQISSIELQPYVRKNIILYKEILQKEKNILSTKKL